MVKSVSGASSGLKEQSDLGLFCFHLIISSDTKGPVSCSCTPDKDISEIIRIYDECEGRIEKSVPRITVWNHEACQVMTNGDPEVQIFSILLSPES